MARKRTRSRKLSTGVKLAGLAVLVGGVGVYAYRTRNAPGGIVANLMGKQPVAVAAKVASTAALPAPAASAEATALYQSSLSKWKVGDKSGSEADYQAMVARTSKTERAALATAYGVRS